MNQSTVTKPFEWDSPTSMEELLNAVLEIKDFPDHIARALKGVDESLRTSSYREGGWTLTQLVHHLADAHLNAFIRTKHMVTGDAKEIQPFDQDAWSDTPDAHLPFESSVVMLLGIHQRWSLLLLECLKKPAEYLARTLWHPEYKRAISLSDFIRLYAWHGRHHLTQIEKITASEQT
jgi:hypothetical protein